ncbi:hypothetical protein THRCLA_11798 [Thraustotheca clavata]|uniref:Secreted protein n=1 Tax=Thraustotheca clavata TaxID=74557 RepID=A0A0A7CMR3_9STRA|nr:secreted protein [Thraustotheca clavata]OQR81365.1 hypothetical protein THRCLA_11798 [Thraustotheca clavata]
MKLLYLAAVLAATQADIPNACTGDVFTAYTRCAKFLVPGSQVAPIYTLKSLEGHLAMCYGDWPECTDIQRLGVTPAADCNVFVPRNSYENLKTIFRPCENPMPPRYVDKQLCTANHLILSEYNGQLYTDVVRNNDNEKLVYNTTYQTITVKSNGQCLQAVANHGYDGVATAPCDIKLPDQKWTLSNNRVQMAEKATNACLQTDPFQHSALVTLGPCDKGSPLISKQFFTDCSSVTEKYVYIVSTRGKRVSEYYTGLYFNTPANNFNELFTWDATTQMFKSASNQQCLDSFLDSDGKYKIHTYDCDANNGNQKWIVHADTKQIEHATHKGQCLDGDPTYGDHHLQMWACVPNNENQQWNIEAYNP